MLCNGQIVAYMYMFLIHMQVLKWDFYVTYLFLDKTELILAVDALHDSLWTLLVKMNL